MLLARILVDNSEGKYGINETKRFVGNYYKSNGFSSSLYSSVNTRQPGFVGKFYNGV